MKVYAVYDASQPNRPLARLRATCRLDAAQQLAHMLGRKPEDVVWLKDTALVGGKRYEFREER